MRKLILLVSILLLLVASSCSMGGSSNAGQTETENLISAAVEECISERAPSSTSPDGSKTFNVTSYQAGNGVVLTGTIIIDAGGSVISVSITEFPAGGSYGTYEAEKNSDGVLVATTRTVRDIGIVLKSTATVLYEDSFNPSVFLVSVRYSDGTERLLGGTNLVIPEYEIDSETGEPVWKGKVEATYAGITKTAEFEVKDTESGSETPGYKVITNCDIVQNMVFLENQKFRKDAFSINVTYSDGSRETLSGSDFDLTCSDEYVKNGSVLSVTLIPGNGLPNVTAKASVVAYKAYDISVTPVSEPIRITSPGTFAADSSDFRVEALFRGNLGSYESMELDPEEFFVTIDAVDAGEHANEVRTYTATVSSLIFSEKKFTVQCVYGNDAVTIPGAPAVNTDEEFVRSYTSSLLSSLKSEEAFAFDTSAIVLSSYYYFFDWAQKQLGTTNLDYGTYKVDDSFSAECWADDQDGGFVYTYNGFRITIPYGNGSYNGKYADVRVWGKGELYSNRAAGQDQIIAFEVIVEIDGNIYNAISDGFVFDFDKDPSDPTLFQGPLEVNGIYFDHVVIEEYSM